MARRLWLLPFAALLASFVLQQRLPGFVSGRSGRTAWSVAWQRTAQREWQSEQGSEVDLSDDLLPQLTRQKATKGAISPTPSSALAEDDAESMIESAMGLENIVNMKIASEGIKASYISPEEEAAKAAEREDPLAFLEELLDTDLNYSTVNYGWLKLRRLPKVVRDVSMDDPLVQDFFDATEALFRAQPPEPDIPRKMLKNLAGYGDMDVYELLPAMTDAMPEVVQKMDAKQLISCLHLLGHISKEATTERAFRVQTLARDFASTMLDAIASKVAAGEMNEMSLIGKVRTIWSLGELGLPPSEAAGIARSFLDRIPTESLHELPLKELSDLSWGLAQLDIREVPFLQKLAYAINEAIIVDIEKKVKKSNSDAKPLFREYLPLIAVSFARLGLPLQDEANLFLFRAVGTRLQTGVGLYQYATKWVVAALCWSFPSEDESGLSHHLKRLVVKHKLDTKFIETAWVGPTRWVKPPPPAAAAAGRSQKQSQARR